MQIRTCLNYIFKKEFVNPVEADTFNAPLCPHKLAWRSDAVWDELGPLMILGHNVTVGWSEPVHVCAQLNHSSQNSLSLQHV